MKVVGGCKNQLSTDGCPDQVFAMSFFYVVSQTTFTFFMPLLLKDAFSVEPRGTPEPGIKSHKSHKFSLDSLHQSPCFEPAAARHWDVPHCNQLRSAYLSGAICRRDPLDGEVGFRNAVE